MDDKSTIKGRHLTSQRPSVLIIGPTPPPFHGVAVATQNLLNAQDNGRIELTHLDIADRRGITHVDQPDLHDVYQFCKQWFRLAWILIWRRPQVVYLSISQSTIGFLRDSMFVGLARAFRRKIVIHLHGGNFRTWHDERTLLMKKLIQGILSCATRLIVLADIFRESLGSIVASEKIVVVPNGIPWRQSAAQVRTGARGQKCRVLFLSTLSREKGALLLIEAIAQILGRRHDVVLTLAGPWLRETDRVAALQLIEKYALHEDVLFPGQVDGGAKVALFEAADIFVFPGIQQEGQPLVVLEAMASSLPVVFSNRGCLIETVISGESGLEFNVNDPADLAKQLSWLMERPSEIVRMGANARKRYEELYSERHFISNMTQVFLDTVRSDPLGDFRTS